MPAKDRYHDTVKRALIKDGWTIDDEQVVFIIANRQVIIDLQASKDAQSATILVEVKGFQRSPIEELAIAAGKLLIYRFVLDELGENIPLWIAAPETAHHGILTEIMGIAIQQQTKMNLLVFSPEREEIIAWIPYAKS